MSKLLTAAFIGALVSAIVVPAVHAAEPSAEQRAAMKQKWDSMSPEEKAAARERMKQKWDSMSPEEQAAAKKRFAERHPRAAGRLADRPAAASAAAR